LTLVAFGFAADYMIRNGGYGSGLSFSFVLMTLLLAFDALYGVSIYLS
jgi:hypothetical protein